MTEHKLEAIRNLAADGRSELVIGEQVGLTLDEWLQFKENDPDVQAALKEGRCIERDKLLSTIKGGSSEGVAGAVFLLMNRHGFKPSEIKALML